MQTSCIIGVSLRVSPVSATTLGADIHRLLGSQELAAPLPAREPDSQPQLLPPLQPVRQLSVARCLWPDLFIAKHTNLYVVWGGAQCRVPACPGRVLCCLDTAIRSQKRRVFANTEKCSLESHGHFPTHQRIEALRFC